MTIAEELLWVALGMCLGAVLALSYLHATKQPKGGATPSVSIHDCQVTVHYGHGRGDALASPLYRITP